MTEAELLEISQLAFSNSLASFAIFVCIASAYIVAAFFVGNKLSRSQVFIVNGIFISCMLTMVYGVWGFSNGALGYASMAAQAGVARSTVSYS